MPATINPIRYPTVYAYLSRLPAGLASFPDITCSVDMPLIIRTQFPDMHRKDDLPADVQQALSTDWQKKGRVPEAVFMLQNALVRDVVCRDDDKYLAFCYETTAQAFQGLIVRSLLFFISPKVAALGASRYWRLFKEGTTLTSIGGGKTDHTLALTHPEGLYLKCMLEGIGRSFLAAIDAAGAKNGTLQVQFKSFTTTHFVLSWS